MNVVNNACVSSFSVQRGHLFIWDVNHENLWTTQVLKRHTSFSNDAHHDKDKEESRAPRRRRGRRRLSIAPDKHITVNGYEGVMGEVIRANALVMVSNWSEDDGGHEATEYDIRAGFVNHSIVACPINDAYGLEVIGVLVLVVSDLNMTAVMKH